jgi:pimeloyl-ACP methyl ester carboxylesterase
MAKPQGNVVQVNRGKMHIRQMGAGEKTIVLLPGLGCPLPTVEFAPLMRKLSQKHNVCTVELFGYGFSDSTNTPRTNENYVEEIRQTLRMAGMKPPYALMPYSASGIYAEYYAAKYPDEIAGLILLDSTPTVEAFAELWTYTEEEIEELKTALVQAESSEETPLDEEALNKLIAEFLSHGYTLEELEDIDEVPNHQDTLIAQYVALSGNIREVLTMPIPKHIPILLFSSSLVELDDDERVEHENYREDHMTRLGDKAKLVVIEGSNHLNITYHRDYLDIISKEVEVFLNFAE